MRYITIAALLMGGLCCTAGAAGNRGTEDAKQLHRKKLAQETQIGGYACAKGYAWLYADGRLNECAVARETAFGEAHIPAGSWISLTKDGRPYFVFLEHVTEIAGYRCEGGNWLLGPTEGAMTGLYPSGKLKVCWLAEDRHVQRVPCARSGIFTGDSGVQFYESGRLKACKLSMDYSEWKRGQRFSQGQ